MAEGRFFADLAEIQQSSTSRIPVIALSAVILQLADLPPIPTLDRHPASILSGPFGNHRSSEAQSA
jgi:hypothetical protein